MPKPFLRTAEVATLLGCTERWVRRLIEAKELDAHRFKQRGWWRVPRKSLEAYASEYDIELDWELLKEHEGSRNNGHH